MSLHLTFSSCFASSCLCLHSFHSPCAFSSMLLCLPFIILFYIASLSLLSHSSHCFFPFLFCFLCISDNCSSSLSNTSHDVVMKRLSLKSLTNCILFCPHVLDNVMYMLNGVRCPLNGIPMSAHKHLIIWPMNATDIYMVDLSLMEKYYGKLEPGNIIMVGYGLEKHHKTKFTKCDKVTFKMLGICYICKGYPPPSELSRSGASVKEEIL